MERHEHKLRISFSDVLLLRSRLGAVMQRDPYTGPDGTYRIRSYYFDDCRDSALAEKISGVNCREKYRLRTYNNDFSMIRLECKAKQNNLSTKTSALLSREQAEALICREYDWMKQTDDPFLQQCAVKFPSLYPKTIVEYTREPYIFPAGNVRVTIDSDIRTGIYSGDFFSSDLPLIPTTDTQYLLEIKYDNFLPDIIRCMLQLDNSRESAFSKYAFARCFD